MGGGEFWDDFVRIGAITNGDRPAEYHRHVVYLHTKMLFRLCDAVAREFMHEGVDVVVAASARSITISQWVAYFLTHVSAGRNVIGIYAEESMRMGTVPWVLWKSAQHPAFDYENLLRGNRVLIVDEALHAGCSAQKVTEVIRYLGANIVGIGAFCNCSDEIQKQIIDVPKISALVSTF